MATESGRHAQVIPFTLDALSHLDDLFVVAGVVAAAAAAAAVVVVVVVVVVAVIVVDDAAWRHNRAQVVTLAQWRQHAR